MASAGGQLLKNGAAEPLGFKELLERVKVLESKEGFEEKRSPSVSLKELEGVKVLEERVRVALHNFGGECERLWNFCGDLVKDVQEVQSIVGSRTFEDFNFPSLVELDRQVVALAEWKQELVTGREQEVQTVVEKIILKIPEVMGPMIHSSLAANLPEAIEEVGEKLLQVVQSKYSKKEEASATWREVQQKVGKVEVEARFIEIESRLEEVSAELIPVVVAEVAGRLPGVVGPAVETCFAANILDSVAEAVEPLLQRVMNAMESLERRCRENEMSVSGFGLDWFTLIAMEWLLS